MDVRIALLALFSCLLMASPASAQALQVLDGTSRQPVIGAVLSSKAPARQAVTDSTGSVGLAGFPDSALVRVEHISYEPLRIRCVGLAEVGWSAIAVAAHHRTGRLRFFRQPLQGTPAGCA
ncbi:MAG: hypothetical protein IPI95_13595 [Flavobacteriales bacterium]|nr:hypothetical protein [Flavobacteriales bacterium]